MYAACIANHALLFRGDDLMVAGVRLNQAWDVAFSANCHWLIVGTDAGAVPLHLTNSDLVPARHHNAGSAVFSVATCPLSPTLFYTGTRDGRFTTHDTRQPKPVAALPEQPSAVCVLQVPESSQPEVLCGTMAGTLRLYDVRHATAPIRMFDGAPLTHRTRNGDVTLGWQPGLLAASDETCTVFWSWDHAAPLIALPRPGASLRASAHHMSLLCPTDNGVDIVSAIY